MVAGVSHQIVTLAVLVVEQYGETRDYYAREPGYPDEDWGSKSHSL